MKRRGFIVLEQPVGSVTEARTLPAVRPDLPFAGSRERCLVFTDRPVHAFQHAGAAVSLIIGRAAGIGLRRFTDVAWSRSPDAVDPVGAAREIASSLDGAYIAIVSAGDGIRVMADPSGALPFDMASGPAGAMATDRLDHGLMDLVGVRPCVDWRALATTIVAPATATHLGHLRGTRPAIPGRLHLLRAPDTWTKAWSPADIARDVGEGSGGELRTAVDAAVAACEPAACVMQLSGGLDSSIVLSSLCRATDRPPSINLATSAIGGDERRYARIVANACNSPLREFVANGFPSYQGLFERPAGAHPFVFGQDDLFENAVADAARASGRTSVMTGQGGDAAFLQPATPLVAVDRLRALGLRASSLRPLLDDARRSRSSVWHHFIPALADRLVPARVPRQLVVPRLLTPEARRWVGDVAPDHPWVEDAADLPPGKRLQITMLANSQIFHSARPYANGLGLEHPLLSRRVLQAVLPIPTYELAMGRKDRGLARAAFAERLPAQIVERRTKGDAADHYSRAALANLPFLREVLLGGVLVREGIVDPVYLDAVLTPDHLFYSLDYHALVIHAACEAWASYWAKG